MKKEKRLDKMKNLKLVFTGLLAITLHAQTGTTIAGGRTIMGQWDASFSSNTRPFRTVGADPTGACATNNEVQWNPTTGRQFMCRLALWIKTFDVAASSGGDVTLVGVQTLTNKTLTSPVINSPTGLVRSDLGLGNVDNTSDATKNAATVTLTNKSITGNQITSVVPLATSLAVNGANCPTGEAAGGTSATGVAENCVVVSGGSASITLLIERISDTQIRIGNNCTVSVPCLLAVGAKVYSKTAGFTATLSGTLTAGDILAYLDSATGNFIAAHDTNATVTCLGCTTLAATATHPIDSILLAKIPFATNIYGVYSATWNKQATLTTGKRIVFGAGMTGSSESDDTVTFVSTAGGASPAGSGTELQVRASGTAFAAITGSSFASGILNLANEFVATTNSRARFFQDGAANGALGLKESGFNTEVRTWVTLDPHNRAAFTFGSSSLYPSVKILSSAGIQFTNRAAVSDAKLACAAGPRGHLYPTDSAAGSYDFMESCIQTPTGHAWAKYLGYVATSTGAVTATLGANSPAVTTTPRGWISMKCPDDITATCFMPYWK